MPDSVNYPIKTNANALPGSSDSLLAVLQAIQREHSYLPEAELRRAAEEAGVSVAAVYGLATFYAQFRMTPP